MSKRARVATPSAAAAASPAASHQISKKKKVEGAKTVADFFDTLEYGPAPESDANFKKWVDSHDKKFGCFINNKWVHHADASGKYNASECPATKEVLCHTMAGTEKEIDMATEAAATAFKTWSTTSPHERAKHLYSIARHIQKHERLLSVTESLDNGKSYRETRTSDIPLVARWFYHHAGWAQLMDEEMADYKPIGVIGEIVPWNFPLMLLAWKVCPALAMGNTIVLKPASVTRLTALLFAEICAEAGLPPGVFNLVSGGGALGSYLADHRLVDKIAFTGSTPIGQLLRTRIAGSGKKISLELGGKSPVIVFDTADLDSVVEGVVNAIFFNQGQVCSAGSRLIVQENVHDKLIAKLKARIDHFRIGHPLEKNIDMGALVDQSQYDTIKGFVERAEKEGGVVYKADVHVPTTGWFWPPTIITNVFPVSECVREEIFGPVLAVMKFRNPEEAIKLANNTKFGLAGSVWTENVSLALEVAVSIKAGAIWVNAHNMFDAAAGFGGYRESGFGRDGGKEGLYEFAKVKWEPDRKTTLKFPCEAAKWRSTVNGQPALPDKMTPGSFLSTLGGGGMKIDRTPKIYIGGKQCRPDGQYSNAVYDPKGNVIGQVSDGNRKDMRNAVEAAHAAAKGWGKRAAHNRAQICYYIAENLMARGAEFAARIHEMTGRPMKDCEKEVATSIERLFYYAAYADKFGGTVQETTFYGLTAKIHEPVGVIGMACPDEYPLLGFISCIAPALVRGNTMIVIPSPKHPLSATDLYQVFDTSDLPGGVLNIVTGDRDTLMKTLAEHQDVQGLWYFGDEQGSQNCEFSAAINMKRTWVNYGHKREWMDMKQGQGMEFLLKAIEVKNVWVPMGECK